MQAVEHWHFPAHFKGMKFLIHRLRHSSPENGPTVTSSRLLPPCKVGQLSKHDEEVTKTARETTTLYNCVYIVV